MYLVSPYAKTPENAELIKETYVSVIEYEGIVQINEVFEQMYQEFENNWLDASIDASINRKEHEWYGMEPAKFRLYVRCGDIELYDDVYEAGTAELYNLIEDFLVSNNYFFEDAYNYINAPLQEVW